MRKAVVVLVSVVALVLGFAVDAGAAAKPAYKVTLRTSVAKSTADHFITVSGKVTGPRAARHTVTIQRQYVGGPWITVAHATIKSNGRYSASVETPKGGTTSFRALKAKSSVRRAGASAVRSIPVYQWLNLANLSSLHDNTVQPGIQETIGGKTFASVDFFDNANIAYKLGGLCTNLTAIADYRFQSGVGSLTSIDLALAKYPIGGGPATPVTTPVSTDAPVPIATSLAGINYLSFTTANYDAGYVLVLGNPQVLCNASTLPAWTESELA